LDNTLYDVYFVAQNNYPGNPDIMSDNEVVMLTFLTQTEYFNVDEGYEWGPNLNTNFLLILSIIMIYLIREF